MLFFLWVGIFNLMIIAQFWSFANDLYTKEQGERLFALVAFGGSAGAVLASVFASQLIPLVGVPQLLLIAAALLLAGGLISNLVDARERARQETTCRCTSARRRSRRLRVSTRSRWSRM